MSDVYKQVLRYVRLPFEGDLHDFQKEDLNKFPLLDTSAYYYDLGLGKTVMAAITGGWRLLQGFAATVVVLCPASLGFQWYEVLVKMGFKTTWYVGSPGARKRLDIDVDFLVVSYNLYQNDYDRLKRVPRPFFVIDEATILCNSNNKLWRMLEGGIVSRKQTIKLPNGMTKVKRVDTCYEKVMTSGTILTATPINNPMDAFGLIKVVSPNLYVNKSHFEAMHVDTVDHFGAPKAYKNLDILAANLQNRAITRMASDHIDLPEKVYNIIEYDLAPDHYKLYKELVETRMVEFDGKIQVEAMQAQALYNAVQKIILNPDIAGYKKPAAGMEILETVVNSTKQAIVINKYIMTNNKMMEVFKKIGVGGCYGEISRPNQDKFIKAFKEGRLRVLTLHPKSGGYGLNLQNCNQEVIPELPVTVRELRQCEGRAWRQGQKERVVITILMARKTIQVKLLRDLMNKDDIMREVMPTPRSLRDDLFGK